MLTYWEIETEDPRPSASGSRLMTGQVKAFVDLVAKMRRAQAAHRKTLIYGYRTESIHLEAEVDAALKELQGSIGYSVSSDDRFDSRAGDDGRIPVDAAECERQLEEDTGKPAGDRRLNCNFLY